MARPASWLPRLHEIRRSVKNSVRSHYDRRDLELLFKLQPRGAGKLLEMLVTDKSSRSGLVKRETLQAFLDRVAAADDVPALLDQIRTEKTTVTRRRPRTMVRRDFTAVEAASLSAWISRGHLDVRFESAQHLADILWRLASALEYDLEEFLRLYEPAPPVKEQDRITSGEMRELYLDLERIEGRAGLKSGHQTDTKQKPLYEHRVNSAVSSRLRIPHSPPDI
jgi:hypothetical protein